MNGLTIDALSKKYALPRTTVWHYVHDVILPEKLKRELRSRRGGSQKRSLAQWSEAKERAEAILSELDVPSAWPILFAALYWAEGTKRTGFVFTNTDADMIRVVVRILRTHLDIQNEDLQILVRTCEPMKPNVCKKYWANVIGVSTALIHINHNDLHNKSKTQFGMCRITLRKGSSVLKLTHCLIREMTAKILVTPEKA